MADVTISGLGHGTPTTGIILPWSDGTTTYQAKLSSLITAQGDMGTGSIQLPKGTGLQRGTPISGALRFNTGLGALEFYDGTNWQTINSVNANRVQVLAVGGGGGGGGGSDDSPGGAGGSGLVIVAYTGISQRASVNGGSVSTYTSATGNKYYVHTFSTAGAFTFTWNG